MSVLSGTISTDQRSLIQNPLTPVAVDLPPFYFLDEMQGALEVVSETGNPNSPTTPYLGITGATVKITDGASIVYNESDDVEIAGSVINFSLSIDADALAILLLISNPASVFLEVRIQTAGEDFIVLQTQAPLFETAA